MADDSILRKSPFTDYVEKAPAINSKEFQKVIDSRRAVRIFYNTAIPDELMKRALMNGLLAPNSSNLQPWEFFRVKSTKAKKELAYACLSQSAAKTAQELIVAAALPGRWKLHAREMLSLFDRAAEPVPKSARDYYGKLVPFVYTQGFFSIFGALKRLIYFLKGLSSPIIREPVTNAGLKTWAVKTTALGCENIMLTLSAGGFDSCPMEGFDSKRIKKILKLPRKAVIVMVIAAGKRAPGGIYGPRVRFDPARFIKTI